MGKCRHKHTGVHQGTESPLFVYCKPQVGQEKLLPKQVVYKMQTIGKGKGKIGSNSPNAYFWSQYDRVGPNDFSIPTPQAKDAQLTLWG
jgi:hypothetical protein